jgi:serine O-acetyltransferase
VTDFSMDLDRAYDGATGLGRLRMWVLSSELHCVACYRFGRWARSRWALCRASGAPLVVLHLVWNRWTTNWHHCDISRGAQIGPGLTLMHRHGVLVGAATIGSNCVIHHNVTIGQRVAGGDQGIPRIGDNVWIGPGATLTGSITIGDDVTISAGTILSKSVPAGCLVGGNPGRVIAHDYSRGPDLDRVTARADASVSPA